MLAKLDLERLYELNVYARDPTASTGHFAALTDAGVSSLCLTQKAWVTNWKTIRAFPSVQSLSLILMADYEADLKKILEDQYAPIDNLASLTLYNK